MGQIQSRARLLSTMPSTGGKKWSNNSPRVLRVGRERHDERGSIQNTEEHPPNSRFVRFKPRRVEWGLAGWIVDDARHVPALPPVNSGRLSLGPTRLANDGPNAPSHVDLVAVIRAVGLAEADNPEGVFRYALYSHNVETGVAEWLRDWEVVEVRVRADLVNEHTGLVGSPCAIQWNLRGKCGSPAGPSVGAVWS